LAEPARTAPGTPHPPKPRYVPRRVGRRRRTSPWWWFAGAGLVLVAGGVGIAAANATVYAPEAPVEDYLRALKTGDGGTALALSGGGSPDGSTAGAAADAPVPGTATTLLQGGPLQSGYAALGEVEVSRGAEAPDGGSVEVEAGYTVDGERHRTTFTVQRLGREWLFFERWRMAPVPLQTVRVQPVHLPPEAAAVPVTAVVNGVAAPLPQGVQEQGAPDRATTAGQSFAVLPPLVVEAGVQSTYLQAGPARLVVDDAAPADPAQAAPLDLALGYTGAVEQEVNRQLDEYLAACTGQQVLNPAGCPLGYDTVNRVQSDSIQWSVAGDPQATVVPLPAEGEDPTVVAPLEAVAELSLRETDLVTGEQRTVDHREPFTLEAELSVTPESVRYAPRVP
jgi:hypothetical protein